MWDGRLVEGDFEGVLEGVRDGRLVEGVWDGRLVEGDFDGVTEG